jgi:hypothetical protein
MICYHSVGYCVLMGDLLTPLFSAYVFTDVANIRYYIVIAALICMIASHYTYHCHLCLYMYVVMLMSSFCLSVYP